MTTKELAQAVLDAPSACADFKAAAQNYIDTIGTEREAEAGKALVAEAEEDICSIDDVIGFFSTDKAKQIFGEEVAEQKLAGMKDAKANGAIYCTCPGCTAALNIIDNRGLF